VYQKPRLERFGTFRQLTLYGWTAPDCDGGSIYGMGGNLKGCTYVEVLDVPTGGGS
jgi:hypothetical protein